MADKLKSLYIDSPAWEPAVKADDFLVAVGKKQSNSVYHVAQARAVPKPEKRIIRYYVKVFKTDLITALHREANQALIPIRWYTR